MIWLTLLALILIICFGGVLLRGAPYLPSLRLQIDAALKLANLRAGDHLLELGCGDGKVIVAAAKQGLTVTGYELNPLLAAVAWLRTRRYRRQVKIVCGDFWRQDWPPAEAIFTFLLPRYMEKLDDKIKKYRHKPIALLSFAFAIPGREADQKSDGVFRYDYR